MSTSNTRVYNGANYNDAFWFSISIYLALIYTFKIVELRYSTHIDKNKLTLMPYQVVLAYLITLVITTLI